MFIILFLFLLNNFIYNLKEGLCYNASSIYMDSVVWDIQSSVVYSSLMAGWLLFLIENTRMGETWRLQYYLL